MDSDIILIKLTDHFVGSSDGCLYPFSRITNWYFVICASNNPDEYVSISLLSSASNTHEVRHHSLKEFSNQCDIAKAIYTTIKPYVLIDSFGRMKEIDPTDPIRKTLAKLPNVFHHEAVASKLLSLLYDSTWVKNLSDFIVEMKRNKQK